MGKGVEIEIAALKIAVSDMNKRLQNMEQIYSLIEGFESFEKELQAEMEKARETVMKRYEETLMHFTDLLKIGVDAAEKVQAPKFVDGLELVSESAVEGAEVEKKVAARGKRPWENTVCISNKKPELSTEYKKLVSGDLPRNEGVVEKLPGKKEIPEETEKVEIVEKPEKPKPKTKTKIRTKTKTKPTSNRTTRSRNKAKVKDEQDAN
jgi:hypothetical protein